MEGSVIVGRLINSCWFVFKWGLVVCVISAAVAVPYFYRRVDEGIRRRVESLFGQNYPGLKTSVGSAELVAGQGIRIRDLSIVEPGAEGPRAELAYVEEIFIACQTDVKELILRDPVARRVTLRRPRIRATRRPDGSWSAAKLLPLPRFGNQSPEVTVENCTIEIFDPIRSRAASLVLRDLNMTVSPAAVVPGEAGTNVKRNMQGIMSGDNFRRVEFQGSVDTAGGDFSLNGDVEGLRVSPELFDSLPGPLADKLDALKELRAEGEISFAVSYESKAASPLKFRVAGQFSGGRIDDRRLSLPHPLTDVCIKFVADNNGIVVDRLTAACNQAALKMSMRRFGLAPDSPLELHVEIKQLEMDRQLLGILPAFLQDQWQKYRPIGMIDADLTLDFDGRNWRMESSRAIVSFSNVSFTYYKFPYRVDRGKGTLELKDNRLSLDVTAYSGTQPVRMKAEVTSPFNGPVGFFTAKGDDIQLDKAVVDALLDNKTREVVQSLDPRGTINFEYRCRRDAPDQPMLHHLLLTSNRCSIRYAKFPYPIDNISGQLEMIDHSWTFRNLRGVNESAQITGYGYLMPSLNGNEFVLNLSAGNVPLDKQLHDALAPNIQQAWNDLKPQGMVDLSAQIRYLVEQKQLNLVVYVEPKDESNSIEPVHFPYRMDKLKGALLYRDGRVTLQNIEAWHGPVKILTQGSCDFRPEGGWNLRLEGLSVDRLRPDRDLILALPERLKKTVLALNPTGAINLRGNLQLLHDGRSGMPLQSAWNNMRIDMTQGSLQCGVKLENIYGSVILSGQSDGQTFFCRGEIDAESLNYKDCQFKYVKGPFLADDQRVLLGSLVDKSADGVPLANADGSPRTPRSISANLFGGVIHGDGQVSLGAEPRYHLGAVLARADLACMARELIDGKQHMQGKIMASAELHGVGTSRNAMSGRGSVALSDADVYELPMMISLLKILSIRAPDRNAFSKARMDYEIKGEHIYLNNIDFNGDAISLHGSGEMDFQSNINLNFDTTVGRGELDLPIIKQVYRGASKQILQIHVGGTLQNPDIRKDPFPAVNQALQQLQGGRQE